MHFFVTSLPFDFDRLSIDVAKVFGLDFHLLRYLLEEAVIAERSELSGTHSGQTGQLGVADLGTAQQLNGMGLTLQRSIERGQVSFAQTRGVDDHSSKARLLPLDGLALGVKERPLLRGQQAQFSTSR